MHVDPDTDENQITQSPLELENLHFLSWNANSVNSSANKNAIYTLLNNYNPAVFFLQETRHNTDFNNFVKNRFSTYQIFHCPSIKRTSRLRGLITLIHKDIFVIGTCHFSNEFVDILYTTINFRNSKICLINYYRHHTCPNHIFDYVNFPPDCQFVISGDANSKHSTWGINNSDTPQGKQLLDYVSANSISLLNNREPTFHHGKTSIDLTFCSPSLVPDYTFEVLSGFCNNQGKYDHYPIHFSVFCNNAPSTNTDKNKQKRWDTKNAN